MATSLPDIKVINKSSLWLGRWTYKTKCHLPQSAGLANGIDRFVIDCTIDDLNRGRRGWAAEITQNQTNVLYAVADILAKYPEHSFKKLHSWSVMTIFSDDLALVTELANQIEINQISQANAVLPKDVLLRVDPKFKYRTYFKARNFKPDAVKGLYEYFTLHNQELEMSPSLRYFVMPTRSGVYRKEWTQDYYYVDHNSEQWITMLNLKFPGFVRKTMPFQAK